MEKTYHVDNGVIVMHRDLTELDLFVKDFLTILEKHSSYVIISGFVSIATGRTRGTEDVDLFIPLLQKDVFVRLFNDLIGNGFWCYQGDEAGEVYETYLKSGTNIRFARDDEVFPNMEVIPAIPKKPTRLYELQQPQRLRVQDFEFNIAPLECQILYKEKKLSAPKDLADARHLRVMFKEILKEEKFKEFETILQQDE